MIDRGGRRMVSGWATSAVHRWQSNGEMLLASVIVVGEWTGLARGLIGRPYLSALLDVALMGLLAASVRGRRQNLRLHPIDVLVAAFVALAIVEMLNPNVPSLAIALEGFRKTAFAASGYAIVRLRALSLVRLATYVALGSCPALLFGIRQFFVPMPFDWQIVRSSGVAETTFMQANQLRAFSPTAGPFHLGILAACSVLIGVVFSLSRRVEWLIVAMIGLVALVLTITRANWIATAIGTAVAAALLLVTSRVSRRHILALTATLLVGMGVLAFAATIVGGDTWSRWEFYISSVLDPLGARNVQLRFGYWREMVDAILANPFVGYGTSSAADGFRAAYEAAGKTYFQPHSIYFKPVLEMGVLGLVLMIGIIGSTIVGAVRLRHDAPAVAAMVGGLGVIVAVSGMTGPMLDAYPFNLFFWSMLGGLVTTRSQQEPSWTQ